MALSLTEYEAVFEILSEGVIVHDRDRVCEVEGDSVAVSVGTKVTVSFVSVEDCDCVSVTLNESVIDKTREYENDPEKVVE